MARNESLQEFVLPTPGRPRILVASRQMRTRTGARPKRNTRHCARLREGSASARSRRRAFRALGSRYRAAETGGAIDS